VTKQKCNTEHAEEHKLLPTVVCALGHVYRVVCPGCGNRRWQESDGTKRFGRKYYPLFEIGVICTCQSR